MWEDGDWAAAEDGDGAMWREREGGERHRTRVTLDEDKSAGEDGDGGIEPFDVSACCFSRVEGFKELKGGRSSGV